MSAIFAKPPTSELDRLVVQVNSMYMEKMRSFVAAVTSAASLEIVATELNKIVRSANRSIISEQATETKMYAALRALTNYSPPDNIKQHFATLGHQPTAITKKSRAKKQ